MTIDPTRIDREDLDRTRRDIAAEYGISPGRQYTERQAAGLLLRPDERGDEAADTSTLKRKRRAGKISHVPRGDGRVAYLGMMLVDFIAFGERSVLLWGAGGGRADSEILPATPEDAAAPPPRDGGGRGVAQTEAMGGSGGPVHEA